MKLADVKLLWGRSGNRCAFPKCKIELTIGGAISTLGEMAHVVAASSSGPRWKDGLTPEERDSYANRILLCPTHHTLIDKNPKEWTEERLKKVKDEHEKWVSEQLEKERIVIPKIDNEDFLRSREEDWASFAGNYVWIISSITPLNIYEDAINPLEQSLLDVLNNLRLSGGGSGFIQINHYQTRPNENGIINEDLRNLSNGSGYQIQIFRNGHCEMLNCIEWRVREATSELQSRDPGTFGKVKIIVYYQIAKIFDNQIRSLKNIWENGLPFQDMLITFEIANSENTRLYSKETTFEGPLVGSVVKQKVLKYSNVINRDFNAEDVSELTIKRFYNYFGLVSTNVFNEKGESVPPNLLYP